MINITENDHKILSDILEIYLPCVKVWVYGSRITPEYNKYSDLDIVVFTNDIEAVSSVKEALDESDISFKVDLFIWEKLPADFKNNIESNHVVFYLKYY